MQNLFVKSEAFVPIRKTCCSLFQRDRIDLLEYLKSIGRQSFELDDRMKLTLIEADDQQKYLDEEKFGFM